MSWNAPTWKVYLNLNRKFPNWKFFESQLIVFESKVFVNFKVFECKENHLEAHLGVHSCVVCMCVGVRYQHIFTPPFPCHFPIYMTLTSHFILTNHYILKKHVSVVHSRKTSLSRVFWCNPIKSEKTALKLEKRRDSKEAFIEEFTVQTYSKY